MKPAIPKTERPPSTQLRKAVFGDSFVKNYLLLAALTMCQVAAAQSEFFLWAEKGDGAESRALAVDASGNAYLGGSIYGTGTFGTNVFNSPSKRMIFVSKLNISGNITWLQQAAGTDSIYSSAVATDNAGAVYVVGAFYGTATLGSTTLFPNGTSSAAGFIAKLDSNGGWVWAKKLGGSNFSWVEGVWLDTNGDIYITGFFDNSATFGSLPLSSYGSRDAFVAKMNSSGTFIWVTAAGGAFQDYGRAITGDSTGLYIVGF